MKMSKITNLIFNNEKHYITSSYGYRKSINTQNGTTNSFHNGTDYGTNSKKLPQYAIEDGIVLSCGTDKLGGKFVWVKYPRLNVKMLHYHLNKISCKVNQNLTKGTLLGYTGKSGMATGIHLHLSIVNLSNGKYLNPETYVYNEEIKNTNNKNYYKKGDRNEYIKNLCSWFAKNYWGYFCKNEKEAHKLLDGNLFGPYLEKWVKEFQKRTGLKSDGLIGPLTKNKLKSYGFNY